jgi:hypothetical protein
MSNEFDFEAMFEESAKEVGIELPKEDSIIEPEVIENPNIKPVTSVSRGMSFNSEANKPKPKTGKKFITKETVIDKFNVLRQRVELTPSVCDICAFDIAAKHFGNWHNVPEAEHEKIAKALAEHKRVVHPLNQNLIVDESEIPTQWLGQLR